MDCEWPRDRRTTKYTNKLPRFTSYFSAQKSGVQDDRSVTRTQQDLQRGRVGCRGLLSGGLLASLLLHGSADVDEVVGNHAKPDPALHADLTSVATTV